MPPGISVHSIVRIDPDDATREKSAYLLQAALADDPVIHLKIGRNPVLHLTREEARLTRAFLDAMLSVETAEVPAR